MSARLAEDSGDMGISQLPAPASFAASRRALDGILGPVGTGSSTGRGAANSRRGSATGGREVTVGGWAKRNAGVRAQMSKAYRFQVSGAPTPSQEATAKLPVVEGRVM